MASAEELLEVIQRQGNQALQMIAALQDVAAQQREANRIAIERLGAAQGADEGVWLRRLLLEIGFVIPHVCRVVPQDTAEQGELQELKTIGSQLPVPILCDNKGTVFTTNNPSLHINNKALETRWYNVRDYVRDGLLRCRSGTDRPTPGRPSGAVT